MRRHRQHHIGSVDLSFERELDRYSRRELALLVYHIHAPTSDPYSNFGVEARSAYYGVHAAPTVLLEYAGELRAMALKRPTPQEKARDELRLGLMLRDRLGDRENARQTLDRARTLDPLNLDVVRDDPTPRRGCSAQDP